jgi:hypothetical protein
MGMTKNQEVTLLHTNNLPPQLPNIFQKFDEHSLSVYHGDLTTPNVIECVTKIKKAFPSLPVGFYDVFTDRIKGNNFSDERLIDAVNHVIDTCVYPIPTIANFISFDQRIKLFTHSEMLKMNDNIGGSVWSDFKPVEIQGISKRLYASVIDIQRYKLKQL